MSRREVRVVFPRDTARRWGWSAKDSYAPSCTWGVSIEGMDGPKSTMLDLGRFRDTSARTFSSLRALIARYEPGLCIGGMMTVCDPRHTTASVQNNRVILVLRDSAAIRRLFGLRPAHVLSFRRVPNDTARFTADDSVRVEYIAPQIPVPDTAFKTEAALALRRVELVPRRDTVRVSEHFGPEPLRMAFRKTGVHTLVGRLGVRADTLRITVLPSRAK